MTVFTAAATSYIAVATYQDQRKQDEEKKRDDATDFAQRVEFVPGRAGVATLDNPNSFPLAQALIRYVLFVQASGDPESNPGIVLTSAPVLLPACSRLRVDFTRALRTDFGETIPAKYHKLEMQQPSAYFRDRSGKEWISAGGFIFESGTLPKWENMAGSNIIAIYEFDSSDTSWSHIEKSPRCK
ncbi:hypothetical protein ACIA6D_30860 [Streptomyces cacaoi]